MCFFVQAGPSLGGDHGRTKVGHSIFDGLLPAGLGALGKVKRGEGGAYGRAVECETRQEDGLPNSRRKYCRFAIMARW